MIGAIILTAGKNHFLRVLYIENNKQINRFSVPFMFSDHFISFDIIYQVIFPCLIITLLVLYFKKKNKSISIISIKKNTYPFFIITYNEQKYSENTIGHLRFFVLFVLIIGSLLLIINSLFSLHNNYLEKGGGFECGFDSFFQTREQHNVIFYRVSLLFLALDLEIILIFPYPALQEVNQNISKNNVLVFLFILIIGFIYELKEGALNIIKTAHSVDLNVNDLILSPYSDSDKKPSLKDYPILNNK